MSKELIREKIGNKETLAYTLGKHGEKFGLYSDGTTAVGASIGDVIFESKRPIVVVGCIGVNNMDMSYYREGWKNEELSDEDCIRECFEVGDVSDGIEELQDHLIEILEEDGDVE